MRTQCVEGQCADTVNPLGSAVKHYEAEYKTKCYAIVITYI